MSQAVWKHSPRMMSRILKMGKTWPNFEGTEMVDTLAYIKTKAKGAEEPFSLKPNPKEGRAVFNAKGCTKCHSVFGEGSKEGTDLGKRAEAFYTSITQIASHMWNKSPDMLLITLARKQDEVPRFTTKEMTDLLAYLYFLHYTDEPGDASKGEKLFSALGCAQCHGLGGKPGTLMYIDLSKFRNSQPTEIIASIWNHSLDMQTAAGAKGVSWPQLKKGEMVDLLEYIRTPVKQ
jgi:mono/diheme cytochrome c family protein